ncbi:MAG: SGNH/GDSL hydrolase family protein [Limisphaerales bacterium]
MSLRLSKKLWQNLALSAASLLIFIALLEGVFRLLGYGNLEIYEPDPVLYWRLKPNQNCFTKIDHQPVHINSHGTRGPEFQTAKPANTLRIVSLGDSRTFGWGLSEPETYSGLLEQLLQARVGGQKRVEVINAGVNAWSFSQMKIYFRDEALQYRPDLVIIGDANLWTQFSEHNDPAFVKKFMRRVQLKNFLRHFALYHYLVEVQLKEVYERYRTRFIPVDPGQDALFKQQQQKDPEAFFKEAINDLCGIALSNHVRPIVLYLPSRTELESGKPGSVWLAKREVTRRLNLPFVDLTPDLAPKGKALYLETDPVHLNAAGNRIVAQRLVETISPLVSP